MHICIYTYVYEIVTQQNMKNLQITVKENETRRDGSVDKRNCYTDTRPEIGPLAPMEKASVSLYA